MFPYSITFLRGIGIINERSYKKSGVDIDAGADLVERIKPLARSTQRTGVVGAIGGFGGLFDPGAAGYDDPILVAATDGVGTKLKIAIETGYHGSVGIDLVAMCVNDLVVQGAEPLFFLDYLATGRLNPKAAEEILEGITEGCLQAGCALIGGETAEMPGMYVDGEYDLAGFAVGAVNRGNLLPRKDIADGDIILGMASSGLHSNGFSLVRDVLSEKELDFSQPAAFNHDQTWGEALLVPTRIYVKSCLRLHKEGLTKAFAHITGGGLIENIPRILPDGMTAEIDPTSWEMPSIFKWLIAEGGISAHEMVRTFNCGIGMISVVAAAYEQKVIKSLTEQGESVQRIGIISSDDSSDPVVISNLSKTWHV